jgi:dienelactone hydrolase
VGVEAPASAAPTPFPGGGVSWAVGTRQEVVIDRTRPTIRFWSGHDHKIPGRRLTLTFWYPAQGVTVDGADDGSDHADAPAAAGTFPVVAFAPGFDVGPAVYERTLRAWAAAGYIVVAPEFPGSGPDGRGQPTEDDLTQQPKDMSEAIDSVARDSGTAGTWLDGRADLSKVAVAGHSDGGSTVVRMVLSTAYRDPRIDAAIVMSGSTLGGAYTRRPTVPLLLLSGDRDQYNDQSVFAHVYAAAHGPRAWVEVVRGRHLTPYIAVGRQPQTLRQLEIDWLDTRLGEADRRTAFRALTQRPGVTRRIAGGL